MPHRKAITAIFAFSGVLPILWIAFLTMGIPSLDPVDAREMLNRPSSEAVLIDVSSPLVYEAEHILGAISWPFSRIMNTSAKDAIPKEFSGKTLLFICESGLMSAWAAKKMQKLRGPNGYNVSGGLEAWKVGLSGKELKDFICLEERGGNKVAFAQKPTSPAGQWIACAAAFFIKPLYMLLSLILVVKLWRAAARDLVILKWAMTFFLVGESFCALNYLAFGESSHLVEYLHIFGMVMAFAFAVTAIVEAFDVRVLFVTDPQKKCAALALCKSCVKYEDVNCGLRRLFLVMAVVALLLTAIPLTASIKSVGYDTMILGGFYHYSHPALYQLFEIRYAPIAAMVFFLLAAVFLAKEKLDMDKGKLLFCIGAGFLGFSMFRMVLFGVYQDNLVWYIAWEEFTEFMFVAGTGIILLIFNKRRSKS